MNIKRIIAFPFMFIISLILATLFMFSSLFIGVIFGIPYVIVKLWQGEYIKGNIITFFTAPFEIIADLWRISE